MGRSRFWIQTFIAVGALCWATGLATAQQKPVKVPGPGPGQTTIIDAAGRKHIRNPRITDAQRKAVAKRQQAARIKAAKQKGK